MDLPHDERIDGDSHLPSVKQQRLLHIGSLIPRALLYVLLAFVYVFYTSTFLIPMLIGSGSSTVVSDIPSTNQHFVVNQIHEAISPTQQNAIFITIILHALIAIFFVSLYKVQTTCPGVVPENWQDSISDYIHDRINQEEIFCMNKQKQELQQSQHGCQPRRAIFSDDNLDNNDNQRAATSLLNDSVVDIRPANDCGENFFASTEQEQHNSIDQENPIVVMRADSEYEADQRRMFIFNRILDDLEQKHIRFCKKCNQFKPPRTHHCKQCRRCTLKLDHHCQWLNTCIGVYNYKYFLLVLTYAVGILGIICTTYARKFVEQIEDINASLLSDYIVSFYFYFCSTIFLMLLAFSLYHFSISTKNQSTIEFCESKKDSKVYSQGGIINNFHEIFGDNLFTWFLPTTPKFRQAKAQQVHFTRPSITSASILSYDPSSQYLLP